MACFHLVFVLFLIGLFCKTALAVCPHNWQDGVGYCYRQMINTTDYVTWGYANAQCKRMDVRARLPVFKDAMSWNVFTMGTKQMKAKDISPLGPQPPTDIIPFGAYKLKEVWYWVDGTAMSDGANNWKIGLPNGTKSERKNCVGFNPVGSDTGYGDIQCNVPYAYICQMDPSNSVGMLKNPSSVDASMSPPSALCPSGWISIGPVCYREPAATPTIATSDNGIAACAKLDPRAKLPEFYSFQDYDNFTRVMSGNVMADHEYIALGIRKKSGGYFNSDERSYYLNWAEFEPSSGKECVFTNDIHGYLWHAMDCTQTGYIYCQLDTRSVQGINQPQTVPTSSHPNNRETTRTFDQPYSNRVNVNQGGYPDHFPQQRITDSKDDGLTSSLDTFNKYLSQSYTEEEAFGRSVASQLKTFSTALKSDTMYEIQSVLSMKTKQMQ